VARPSETLRVFRLSGGLEGRPERLNPATFSGVGALEVQHIERWLRRNPDLLGEEFRVIASQFSGFDRTRDRPDLLALDRTGKLVVIEIKRDDSGSGQDLQALRYAAYIATLQADDVVRLYQEYVRRERAESIDDEEARAELEAFVSLDDLDEDERPRIVLVAGRFQVGVTNTVLWLARTYDLDISCVQLTPFEVEGELLITSTTLIPLPEAADFEVRVQEKRRRASEARDPAKIDFVLARQFIDSIPAGQWTTYGDVAAAAGSPRGAQAIGTWLLKTEGIPSVWRVLRHNGSVSPYWQGVSEDVPASPEDVIEWLKHEGVEFDETGRAASHQRWRPEDLQNNTSSA
jgi:alkylated DNA nucleotide flippase Atl1